VRNIGVKNRLPALFMKGNCRLSEEKRHVDLLKAFQEVLKVFPNATFYSRRWGYEGNANEVGSSMETNP
jgi:hypothetical protein